MSMNNDLKLDLINGYLSAAGDEQDIDRIRYRRSVFIRDVVLALYDADKRYGLDDNDTLSLGKVVDQVHDYSLAIGSVAAGLGGAGKEPR